MNESFAPLRRALIQRRRVFLAVAAVLFVLLVVLEVLPLPVQAGPNPVAPRALRLLALAIIGLPGLAALVAGLRPVDAHPGLRVLREGYEPGLDALFAADPRRLRVR